jgi:hypothetical protein
MSTRIMAVLFVILLCGCTEGDDPVAIPYCTPPDTVTVGDSIPPLTACVPSPITTTIRR